ncbi:hypothetical protein ES703_109323 [subsurface metagenome]
MADKMAELRTALEDMSDEALRLVVEFAKFLKKQTEKKKQAETPKED